MDLILHHTSDKQQIQAFQYCRLYLGAIFLSDMFLADGITLDDDLLMGQLHDDQSQSIHYSAYQEKPSTAQWIVFAKWVYQFSLQYSLGPWQSGAHQLHRSWPYVGSSTSPDFYIRQASSKTEYKHYRPDSLRAPASAHLNDLPSKFYPIRHPTLHATTASFQHHRRPKLCSPWMRRICPDAWHQRLLHQVEYDTTFSFNTCTSYFVATDGSVVANSGGFGWLLVTTNEMVCAQGAGVGGAVNTLGGCVAPIWQRPPAPGPTHVGLGPVVGVAHDLVIILDGILMEDTHVGHEARSGHA